MDFTYLISISDGDKEFTAQFISTFKSNTESIIKEMESKLDAKDYTALGKHAHQLKPSLEMLKLDTYDTCLFIQDHPEQATKEQIAEIKASCKEAGEALDKEFS